MKNRIHRAGGWILEWLCAGIIACMLICLIIGAVFQHAIAAEGGNCALAADAPSPAFLPVPILKPEVRGFLQ